jgi:superfamily II DNA/RNA helicase
MQCAVHVFVSEKVDGNKLLGWLRPRYDCRLVTSENSREEVNHVAAQWAESKFDVLISTSIALVGNENPKCRHLVCAGYLFDNMQMVQAFGRLRPYMRTPIGHVFVSVPKEMPEYRDLEDRKRFTVLKNQKFLVDEDYTRFKGTMSSAGVREWCVDASTGEKGCALKILSAGFGTTRENCMACLFCRSAGLRQTQDKALQRSRQEIENSQSAERVLHKLALVCLVCRQVDCRGFPILKGEGSKL